MGTGWRRAFCTTIPRDPETSVTEKKNARSPSPSPSPSPRIRTKFGFLSGATGNPSTPRLQSQNQQQPVIATTTTTTSPSLRYRAPPPPVAANTTELDESPKLQCKTTTCASIKSPKLFSSTPSSPRSPARFSLFKTSLRLSSRSSCGICLQSVKTGQGTAIFTAECSHAFHFPCIASHVRKQGTLVCPVCSVNWKEVPLLALHKNNNATHQHQTESSPRYSNNDDDNKQPPPPSNLPNVKTKHHLEQQQSKPPPSDHKLYNDDEPLLSPTAGVRFDSIPEVDDEAQEEEGEEIEEFQGFFVNPTPSSSINPIKPRTKVTNSGDSTYARNVEVKLLPVAAVVSVGRSHETYAVVLKVKAPPPPLRTGTAAAAAGPLLDPGRRAPIDLVAVLDASGSMTGAKLQMMKRAMRLVISSLGSADRLSIISFSSVPRRLMPLRRMAAHGQRSARHIIDRLVCCHGSSVNDALRKATKVLEDRRERNPVATIMLLSDGHDERSTANHGNRRQPSSNPSATRFSHLEIPVHEYGFSHGHEPAEDAFAKCVGGLLSVVVQDLRLQLGFCSGSASAEITAVYSCSGRPTALGPGSVRLGDLYSEEERELLVEFRVPVVPVGAQHVMAVRSCYKDPATQEVVYGKEQALLVPRPHAIRSSDPKIERLRNFFITTRAVAESRRLVVEHNDLANAHQLLSSARALVMQSQANADENLEALEVEMKELRYKQMQQIQRRRTSERDPAVGGCSLDESGGGEPLTPTSAWRAAEQLAKVAIMRKSMNRVSDLHGFENARF